MPTWRWLIIKTGGNQRFIFGSNKRRLNVGASHLVTLLPSWVRDAVDQLGSDQAQHVRPVVLVSGVAELLVDDDDVARHLVEAVARRALRDAPGLEVWGWFEGEPRPDVSVADRLTVALRRHEQHRHRMIPVEARNPGNPFSERCAVSSEPAAFRGGGTAFGSQRTAGSRTQISPTCLAQAAVARESLVRIRAEIVGEALADAVLSEAHLDVDVRNAGWVAVIHADGNGLGQIFSDLGKTLADDEEYLEALGGLSGALDTVARDSLRAAITAVQAESADSPTEWILPLIVGGDDLSAIVDARLARTFVEAYLQAFEATSGADGLIRDVAQRVLGADSLTACAGVAIVKPTHPFSQAYDLAEALCVSAKRVKRLTSRPASAFDVQVFHEAAGRDLEEIRVATSGASGPYVTSDTTRSSGDPAEDEWFRSHGADLLAEAIAGLAGGVLSRSAQHELRSALVAEGSHLVTRSAALIARSALSPARADPAAQAGAPGPEQRVRQWLADHAEPRGLAALDLLDVESTSGSEGGHAASVDAQTPERSVL